ncbi:MAG: hypothetical protein ACM31C_30390 [Acidobacteriota bacterium]
MTILFILIVAIVFLIVMGGMAGSDLMPLACPACYWGGDRSLAGEPRSWFSRASAERVSCRNCGKRFREHPDGSLVEDRS